MATRHGGNTAYPEVKNKAFHLPCEKKMARQKLQPTPTPDI